MKRNSILFFAILFFSISVILIWAQVVFRAGPLAITRFLVAQVGSAVGVTVSIPSNPFNTLAKQLAEKESILSEQERELKQKEEFLQERIAGEQRSQNRVLLYASLAGGVLFLLISLNFYLDWRRRHSA